MEHLTDEEVDLYAAGRLPEERERALEVHYLECVECLARVRDVQDLVNGLRPTARGGAWSSARWPAALAAGLAAVVVVLLLQVRSPRTIEPIPRASQPVALPRAMARTERAPSALPAFALRAPERGEALQRVELLAASPVLLLQLDAREAGAPGTSFVAALLDSTGTSVVSVRGLASDPEGRVVLPVATLALRPGVYTAQLSAGGDTLKIPFEVVAPTSR